MQSPESKSTPSKSRIIVAPFDQDKEFQPRVYCISTNGPSTKWPLQ